MTIFVANPSSNYGNHGQPISGNVPNGYIGNGSHLPHPNQEALVTTIPKDWANMSGGRVSNVAVSAAKIKSTPVQLFLTERNGSGYSSSAHFQPTNSPEVSTQRLTTEALARLQAEHRRNESARSTSSRSAHYTDPASNENSTPTKFGKNVRLIQSEASGPRYVPSPSELERDLRSERGREEYGYDYDYYEKSASASTHIWGDRSSDFTGQSHGSSVLSTSTRRAEQYNREGTPQKQSSGRYDYSSVKTPSEY